MLDFKTYNQEHFTKKQVLQRLLTCTIGLNVSFVICGILQERMLTQPYNDGEFFTSRWRGFPFIHVPSFVSSCFGHMLGCILPNAATATVFHFCSRFTLLHVCFFAHASLLVYFSSAAPSSRAIHLQLRPGVFEPFGRLHHLGAALLLDLAAPHQSRLLRVLVPQRVQHALVVVPVRSPQVRTEKVEGDKRRMKNAFECRTARASFFLLLSCGFESL